MAQPDLLAEKILHTDPQVGFGEASVDPYREHPLDTRGYDALERAQERNQMREEARKKNNEDYYNSTIKNLPEYEREFDNGLSNWRNDIIDQSHQLVKNGVNPSTRPDFAKNLLSYIQAVKNTHQLKKDLGSIDSMPLGTYTNKGSIKGAALNKYDKLAQRAGQGDRSAYTESIMPDVNDPEHFMFDQYLHDKYHNRPDTVTSKDQVSYGPKGERIVGNKVSAKFVTKDEKGNIVPGIDKQVINEDLYSDTTDPNTIQFRNALFSLADKKIQNKAYELKLSDPRYKDLGINQIVSSISANPNDPHYQEYNRNKIAEDIHRKKLEAFQRVSNEKNVGALHEYKKGEANDNPVLSVNNDVTRNRNVLNNETGKNETLPGWIPKEVDLNPDKFKSILINPTNTVNVENNKEQNTKRAANEPYTLTKIYMLPVDAKTGQRVHGDKSEVLNHKNGIVYHPFVEGVRSEKHGTTEKKITDIIPYDQVKSYLDAQDVNLDKLGFNDPLGVEIDKEKDPLGLYK